MSTYIKMLQEEVARQNAQPKEPNLRRRFSEWYSRLPPVSRNRPFAMSEFEVALKTQGRYISPVLLELGWQRKRIWSTTGQYHRYWLKGLANLSISAQVTQSVRQGVHPDTSID